jgi:hypothetical protein
MPVVEVWTSTDADPKAFFAYVGAEPVDSGPNIALLQAKRSDALVLREHTQNVWITNRIRMYVDLLSDPRRGAEQAKHLRDEVIGF